MGRSVPLHEDSRPAHLGRKNDATEKGQEWVSTEVSKPGMSSVDNAAASERSDTSDIDRHR